MTPFLSQPRTWSLASPVARATQSPVFVRTDRPVRSSRSREACRIGIPFDIWIRRSWFVLKWALVLSFTTCTCHVANGRIASRKGSEVVDFFGRSEAGRNQNRNGRPLLRARAAALRFISRCDVRRGDCGALPQFALT
jgi:hypothetical protein